MFFMIGGTISKTRPISSIERRIRIFLKNVKSSIGPAVSSTLVGLNDWVASLQSGGLDAGRIAAKAEGAADVVENVAESLIRNAAGVERKLLSKSLQETLFYCTGFDADIDYSQFKTRVVRYLERHGATSIVLLFLSLYFFNFVWFETGESFRAASPSSEDFEKDMERVEELCKSVVVSLWKPFELGERPLDSSAARKLIRDIEQRLRGPGLETS
jgi:hypothetical protein